MKKAILLSLLLPVIIFAHVTESARHAEILDGCIAPQYFSKPLLQLDFANSNATWERIDNFEKRVTYGYGEKLGRKGFFITRLDGPVPNVKYATDTAWQLFSNTFPVKGMSKLIGVVEFFTQGKVTGYYQPFRERYVNAIFWFDEQGEPLGNTLFNVYVDYGYSTVNFEVEVPENAAQGQLSLGANFPDVPKDAVILIPSASVFGMTADAPFFQDAEVVLPPVRFDQAKHKPLIAIDANLPKGSDILAEVAYASGDAKTPREFGDFGLLDNPPADALWAKVRLLFKTDGKARPVLKSIRCGDRLFSNWKGLKCLVRPKVKRVSPSPSANPAQPLVFFITHEVPLDWDSLKVTLNGEDITRGITPSEERPKDGSPEEYLFTYIPKENFAMRTIYKMVVAIRDIYGNTSEIPLYSFFDKPLEKGVISLREDGQMLLDGAPYLPIAAPYVIPLPVNDFNLDNAFTWLKQVGFNVVYSGRSKRSNYMDYMDKVAEYGLKMYVMPGNSNGANDNNIDGLLENIAREYRHPAVLAWYIGDDTMSHNTPDEMMLKDDAIKAIDPYHPTVQADAMRSVHPFAPVAEIGDTSRFRPIVNYADSFRVELYPVYDSSEKTARECVPFIIDDMKTIARDIRVMGNGAPRHIWAVVQYFEGWNDTIEKAHWKRFPTWEELRAMTWASFIHGARGVQWYSYRYETKRFVHGFMYKEETRENIRRLVGEITPLVKAISNASQPVPPVAILSGPQKDAFENDSVSVMVRKDDEHTYLFALNSSVEPVKARITLPGFAEATPLYEAPRTLAFENGALTDDFKPYEVHIYKILPR